MSDPSTNIYPTGTCFNDALELFEYFITMDPTRIRTLTLVHAICIKPVGSPGAGGLFAHAWIEEGDIVWSAGILNGVKVQYSCEAQSFREQLQLQDETRYSAWDVHRENRRTGTFGPWVEKYRALCG